MDAPGLTQLLTTTAPSTEAPQAGTGPAGYGITDLQKLLFGADSPLSQQEKVQLGGLLYKLKEMGGDEKGFLGITKDRGIDPTQQAGLLQQAINQDQFGWLQDIIRESGGAMGTGVGPTLQVREAPVRAPEGLDWQSGRLAGSTEPSWTTTPEAPKLTASTQGQAISPFRETPQMAFASPLFTQRGLQSGTEEAQPLFSPGQVGQTTQMGKNQFDMNDMINRYKKLPLFQPTMTSQKGMGWSEGLADKYSLSNLV